MLSSNGKGKAVLFTDESRIYTETGKGFAAHEKVHHARGEFARGDVNTNTIEGAREVGHLRKDRSTKISKPGR